MKPAFGVLALLVCASIGAQSLDLEGHVGYLMVPSARTMPASSIFTGWNRHENIPSFAEKRNVFVGMSPMPWTEVVARMSFPDIGANAKVGVPVYTSAWGSSHVGFGAQDVWGGARFFHSRYLVATQTFGLLETTLGWGTGDPDGEYEGSVNDAHRLEGFFHAISIEMPLPQMWDTRVALIEEHDGWKRRVGARADWNSGAWSIGGLLATATTHPSPEFQFNLVHRLPDSAVAPPANPWESAPLVVQFGPWAQTFLGTEVGNFDAQLSVDAEAFVTPPVLGSHLVVGSRVRKQVYQTENLEPGKLLHGSVVETDPWWESGTVGFAYPNASHEGALLQGGWIDGDCVGSSLEARSRPFHGLRAGGLAGWWHSTGWNLDREVFLGMLDWDSPGRTWFARLDGGRYWGQDLSSRIRLGRRWGRLESSIGFFRTPEDNLVEGRVAWNFGGWEIPVGDVAILRPVPVWKHAMRTRIAEDEDDHNALRPSPAREPSLLLRLRD